MQKAYTLFIPHREAIFPPQVLLRPPLSFVINQPSIVTRRTITRTGSGYLKFHLANISKATAIVVIYPTGSIAAIIISAHCPTG
jgi:hypothetical protein